MGGFNSRSSPVLQGLGIHQIAPRSRGVVCLQRARGAGCDGAGLLWTVAPCRKPYWILLARVMAPGRRWRHAPACNRRWCFLNAHLARAAVELIEQPRPARPVHAGRWWGSRSKSSWPLGAATPTGHLGTAASLGAAQAISSACATRVDRAAQFITVLSARKRPYAPPLGRGRMSDNRAGERIGQLLRQNAGNRWQNC